MTSEHEIITTELRKKIQTIISLYEQQKAEKTSLKIENQKLEQQLKIDNEKLNEIEVQFQLLKTAKSIAVSVVGSQEAKQRVNKIVREIDKCISLMNK